MSFRADLRPERNWGGGGPSSPLPSLWKGGRQRGQRARRPWHGQPDRQLHQHFLRWLPKSYNLWEAGDSASPASDVPRASCPSKREPGPPPGKPSGAAFSSRGADPGPSLPRPPEGAAPATCRVRRGEPLSAGATRFCLGSNGRSPSLARSCPSSSACPRSPTHLRAARRPPPGPGSGRRGAVRRWRAPLPGWLAVRCAPGHVQRRPPTHAATSPSGRASIAQPSSHRRPPPTPGLPPPGQPCCCNLPLPPSHLNHPPRVSRARQSRGGGVCLVLSLPPPEIRSPWGGGTTQEGRILGRGRWWVAPDGRVGAELGGTHWVLVACCGLCF